MRMPVDVAIIGAGPYGLSLANGLRQRGIDFRIFGKSLESWKANMPPGMMLKSYPWASNLYAAQSGFTVKEFCKRRTLPYHDTMMALPRETFVAYGEEFQSQLVPDVEPRMLRLLTRTSHGFRAEFDDGQVVDARRVIIAVGVQHFRYLPKAFEHLPPEVCSHSCEYGALDRLAGRDVTVIGAGSSGTDLAALLHQEGVPVCLVARANELKFAGAPRHRGFWERLSGPSSGIGEGWVFKICAEAPRLVRLLPQAYRQRLAYHPALGPLGGAFMRDRVIGKVWTKVGLEVSEAISRGGKVHLHLRRCDGTVEAVKTDHVICATGYRVDVQRLNFLERRIQADLRRANGAPVLAANYESSVPGLHFIGPISASSFGPVARFVFGTQHPSRSLPRYLAKALCQAPSRIPEPAVLSPVGTQ